MKRWIATVIVLVLRSCGGLQPLYAQTPSVIVQTTVSCATSVDGTVVGVGNPLAPPIVAAGFSGTLPAGNYFTQIAWYDAAGRVTLVSPEVQTQLSGTGSLTVSPPASGMPATAVGMKVYIGATSGGERLQGQTVSNASYAQSAPLGAGAAEPTANGTICALVANDAGWPSGTGYAMSMTTPAGDTVPGFPAQVQLLGPGSSINLGNGLPLYNGKVTYPAPILAQPYNHTLQSISGPLSLSGYKLSNVGSLGVGTLLPGWPIDVENGFINTNLGYLINGTSGTSGQCLASGGGAGPDTWVNCITSLQTLFYQKVASNGAVQTQEPTLNFSSQFPLTTTGTGASGQTNVSLQTVGTAGTYAFPSSITTDTFGRVTSVTAGVSPTLIDYYWNQAATCTPAIGNGQSCASTVNLPGAMPDSNYVLTCNVNKVSGPASLAGGGIDTPQASYPTASGGAISVWVSVIQQNGETVGPSTTIGCHAHHS